MIFCTDCDLDGAGREEDTDEHAVFLSWKEIARWKMESGGVYRGCTCHAMHGKRLLRPEERELITKDGNRESVTMKKWQTPASDNTASPPRAKEARALTIDK